MKIPQAGKTLERFLRHVLKPILSHIKSVQLVVIKESIGFHVGYGIGFQCQKAKSRQLVQLLDAQGRNLVIVKIEIGQLCKALKPLASQRSQMVVTQVQRV